MLSSIFSLRRFAGPVLSVACLLAIHTVARAEADVPSNAPPQVIGELLLPFSIVTGAIKSPLESHYYSFDAEAGRDITIFLRTATLESSLDAVVALYDSNLTLLAYNDKEWNLNSWEFTDDPILYIKTPMAGRYYIRVISTDLFHSKTLPASGSTGSYELTLLTRFPSTFVNDAYEENDQLKQAKPISIPFTSIGANLLYFGDIDWYVFSAKKGERISIDIDAAEKKGTPGWDIIVHPRLGLFDESGKLLASSEAAYDPDDGFDGDPALAFDVPRDGKYYIVVTTLLDTQFAGGFNSTLFLKDPYVSSTRGNIGSYQLEVKTLRTIYFTQIANGSFGEAGFATSMLLVNFSGAKATGKVELFKSDGTPFEGAFRPTGTLTSTAWFEIAPKSGTAVKTEGKGEGSSGYAVVTTTAPVGGCALFSQYDAAGKLVTEAAVSAASMIDFFTFPAQVLGDFNTGFAVANLTGGSRATMYLKLIDASGQPVATRDLSLDPGKQMSVFLGGKGQLFPNLSNFQGSVQVLSDSPVAAIALRTTARTLTTLPVVPLNQSFDSATLLFPQVVFGTAGISYRSTIILTNSSYFAVNGSIQFTRSDGSPMTITIGSKRAAVHDFRIPAQGSLFLEAASTESLQTGYAVVSAAHSVGGAIIYSQYEGLNGKLQTEVGVSAAGNYRDFFVFAQSDNEYNTGLALANTGSSSSAVNFQLVPGDKPADALQQGPLALEPGKQRASLIAGADQIFPAFAGSGALEVVASQPVSAVALRITATTMTALPIVPAP